MTDPIPSLHKLLTASELGQSVQFDASEVQELSEAIVAVHMTQAAIWNEHQHMAAELQKKHSTVH